jgi:signal transduction histidine kinase
VRERVGDGPAIGQPVREFVGIERVEQSEESLQARGIFTTVISHEIPSSIAGAEAPAVFLQALSGD